MIENDKIIDKFKTLKTEDLKSFYGFWDMYKRTLTLRIFATAYITNNGVKKLTHVKEVIRFAPNGLSDYENYTDRKGHHHNGIVKDVLWENSLYYHTFTNTWKAVLSNNDNHMTLPINLTKQGKPYALGVQRSYIQPTNWNTYDFEYFMKDKPKIYFEDITEYMQSPSTIKKLNKIKLKDGKTNTSIMSLITDTNQGIYNLYNYLILYKKYSGLKVIYKNKLFNHLNEDFLEILSSDEKYQKFYYKLIIKDKTAARYLTKFNFKKAFEGIDVERENVIKQVKSRLTRLYGEANELRKEIIDIVREYLKNIKWIDKYKYEGRIHSYDDIAHYIDYLVFKHEDRGGLTKAIYLNKNWKTEYDAIIQEIESVKAIERQLKFEKENARIGKAIEEMADMIGIHETTIKNDSSLNKYIVRLPNDLRDYNDQGTALIHCYKNNSEYLTSHKDLSEVLIFIEKNGVRYATATLHENGKLTDFHLQKNIDIEGYEKEKLSTVIKQELLPHIQKLRDYKREQLS